MNDMNAGPMPGTPERPQGLKVICILAFILLSLAILAGLFGWMGMKMIASGTAEEMAAQSGDANAMAQIEEAKAKVAEMGLTVDQFASMCMYSALLGVVALIGAIMMWKLRKMGFYLFVVAEVLAIALPFLMGGKPALNMQTGISWGITVLFMGLFANNLKHMR
ncbi:MAG TPA: hypothetical protein VHL57_06815 [Flavobacteriales bacterium]|jgi:hypothetical protein|nr:hypothetical protein [Flavobacteriales bacterium]